MLLCGLTDKDLRRICRSQYEHPGSAIGYWPKMCLGHVYIVLEPVGSARLTFDDDLYYELCDFMTEVCSESRMRSRTWRGVSKWSRHKDWYIGSLCLDIGSVPGEIRIFPEYREVTGTPRCSGFIRNFPGTLPVSEYSRPIYQSLCLDHLETPRHVRDHIRDSEQPSVIKNT